MRAHEQATALISTERGGSKCGVERESGHAPKALANVVETACTREKITLQRGVERLVEQEGLQRKQCVTYFSRLAQFT